MTEESSGKAVRHARLRWVGAPLLLSGLGLVIAAVYGALTGGSGLTVGLSLFGCGLALASFGANHDTAMALAFASRQADLPEALADELTTELERDRDGVVRGTPVPIVGMVIPFVAVAIQAWVAFRLFGGAA
jgi:hypothetical protein